MKNSVLITLFCCLLSIHPAWAAGAYYVANNILVVIQGPTTSATRDQALLQAQKTALAQFMSVSDATQIDRAKAVPDTSLSRTMKDFSLQNERVLSQSYQASFMIRFDAVKFEGLLRSYNISLPPVKEIDLRNLRVEEQKVAQPADAPVATNPDGTPQPAPPAAPIVVLPVLHIGTRVIVWDEVNAWRDAWLKKQTFSTKAQFVVPVGDIEDLQDAPDTGFIKQNAVAQPGLDNMLKRYQAQTVYIAWARAKQTPNALSVKLYRYQDQKLAYQGEVDAKSRAGYLFDDAVTTTANQIDRVQSGQTLQAVAASATAPQQPRMVPVPDATQAATPAVNALRGSGNSMITAVIPVANMNAWITLQQQLRRVPGVTNLVTNSISANQAIVRIHSNLPAQQLVQSLQSNGFQLQQAGGGRFTLYKTQ